jgi:hypothetical protein
MARFVIVAFNVGAIHQALDGAFVASADVLEGQFKLAITSSVWSWPRVTRRQNGQIVGSPRNIVDRGALLRSQSRKQDGPKKIIFEWAVAYAFTAHSGGGTRRGTMPARPWTKLGLANSKLPQVFIAKFKDRYR